MFHIIIFALEEISTSHQNNMPFSALFQLLERTLVEVQAFRHEGAKIDVDS